MEANDRLSEALLSALDIPKDGRLLTFGAGSAKMAMTIAAARPDILIVACDTTYEITRELSDRALSEGLDNIIIGDTPAGPLVDRALCFESFGGLADMDLVTLRTAILPGGYAIFAETNQPADEIVSKLKARGYQIADELPGAVEAHTIIRAR